jgi:hypothetical protein
MGAGTTRCPTRRHRTDLDIYVRSLQADVGSALASNLGDDLIQNLCHLLGDPLGKERWYGVADLGLY